MKIGRNDPCSCGSGLKYKKCCMDKFNQGNQKTSASPVNDFFSRYNTISLLQSFAGLSLLAVNHGKYVRLEELAMGSLQNYNQSSDIATSEDLREFLDANYPSSYLEDPPVNLFTDLVTFHGGDYIIFPGITENGTFILSNLLSAIFHWPDSGIPEQFISNCRHTATLILAISDAIALRLGYERYQDGAAKEKAIIVPDDASLAKIKAAVTFSVEEIHALCAENGIDYSAINEFLIDVKSSDLHSPHVEESPVIYKPILFDQGKYIIASPATLSFALTDYLWVQAQRSGCMREVNNAYHAFIWNNLQMQLGRMKFRRVKIDGIPIETNGHEKADFYQFDDDKIAYIQYLYDSGKNYKIRDSESGNPFKNITEDEIQKQRIIDQLLSKDEFAGYEVLDLTILSSIGREFMFPLLASEHARTIAIPVFEFDVLFNLQDTKALDLWKFAIAREEQIPKSGTTMLSFLDLFKLYKDHGDSFYLSDEAAYTSIYVELGYAAELISQSKKKTDKHSVLKLVEGRLVNNQVERKDKYAPIYIDVMGLASSELEFMIKGFHQAVWVSPKLDLKEITEPLRHIYWETNDAIAYWLWQIQSDIREILGAIGKKPITVTFELNPLAKFENIDRDFTRDPDLTGKFQTEATNDSFNIIIPSEIIAYLYGADNEGERVLVHHLLTGISKLLAANGQPTIADVRVQQVIAERVPLGMKKKFFILDTSDNLMLDPKNIKRHRYVQDYDTSIVLNSIVPALGKLCPAVGKITTQKQRDDLCHKIVQNALLPILRDKITQYDSTELLKRLIGLNESLIRKREELRVHTPTRIACFVTVEQHRIDLLRSLGDVNKTTIALRCLIEHVAAEPSKGKKVVSISGIDELVAIMDQVISWGSLGDQIHFNLFDVNMSVLPSGRIGVEKEEMEDVFDPYYESKTKEKVSNAISTFNQVFPKNENLKGKDVPKNLDKAFVSDFGISFTRICQFLDGLCHIGFLQSTAYASWPLIDLRTEINKYVDAFDENEFQSAIRYLSLTNRGKIENLPKEQGYEFIDIMPWRFNRMLSYLRKPLILVDPETPGGSKMAYWGVRQVLTCKLYLADQCQSGRIRVPENSEIKKALGKFAQQRGDALVEKIINSIDPAGLIIDRDVYIGPNHSLKNDNDIGDIDVLVIDAKNQILFSLECKSMSPSRNIKEMIDEVEKLFGSESDMGWIDKHMRRHNWIETNRQQVSAKYKIDISEFEIKSIFITNEDMLTPHLKKQTLPLPFMTSYDIEAAGYASLINAKQNTSSK